MYDSTEEGRVLRRVGVLEDARMAGVERERERERERELSAAAAAAKEAARAKQHAWEELVGSEEVGECAQPCACASGRE